MGGWHWLLMWTGIYAAVVGAHWQRICQLAVDIGCRCGFVCIHGSRGAHWVLTWHVRSAGGGEDSDELTPGWVSHIMGLPLLFPMQPITPPTPKPSETQKEAYIPRWRGEARWRLGVVPTTFIIKSRQMPALSFLCSQGVL